MEFHIHRHLSGYAFTSVLTYDLVTTLANESNYALMQLNCARPTKNVSTVSSKEDV
jgi:hypothetical protein